MVRSLVFAFPVVPRNYTRYDAANTRSPVLERPLISLSGLSAKSPTHLGARRGLCVLTIRSRSYRIRLHVSACYPCPATLTPYRVPYRFAPSNAGGQMNRHKALSGRVSLSAPVVLVPFLFRLICPQASRRYKIY